MVDYLPAGMQESFPLLQTAVVVIWQQMVARSDLGGGSGSVGSSKDLFCTVVQGRQGMAREIAL